MKTEPTERRPAIFPALLWPAVYVFFLLLAAKAECADALWRLKRGCKR